MVTAFCNLRNTISFFLGNPSVSNFKSFSRSLEQFFLTVSQNNFGNKIPFLFRHFPNIKKDEAIGRPILYSNWMDKNYVAVDREELRHYVKARLKVFYEEELDVPLVLFDEVLDHVLRIDRIFR